MQKNPRGLLDQEAGVNDGGDFLFERADVVHAPIFSFGLVDRRDLGDSHPGRPHAAALVAGGLYHILRFELRVLRDSNAPGIGSKPKKCK